MMNVSNGTILDLNLRVLVPSTGTWIGETGAAIAMLMAVTVAKAPAQNLMLGIHTCESSMLPLSRTILIKEAIAKGATHVLFVDSDMDFPADAAVRLLSHGKPLVGVNYIRKKKPYTPVTIGLDGKPLYTREGSSGLEEVKHTGFGLFLIDTRVFADAPEPWFPMGWSSDRNAYVGEDTFFFALMRKMGFPVYIDHDLSRQIGHIGLGTWTNDMALGYEEHHGAG